MEHNEPPILLENASHKSKTKSHLLKKYIQFLVVIQSIGYHPITFKIGENTVKKIKYHLIIRH